MADEEKKKGMSTFFTKKLFLFFGIGIIILGVVGASGYYFWQKSQGSSVLGTQENAAVETDKLVKKVSALIEIPTGETPTIATVSDITKLKSQTFFAKAQNGDQVLIYKDAKKAYLYRPSTNKIVEVGPVNLAPSTASESAAPSTLVTPAQSRVVILNGTTTVGLTKSAEDKLVAADPSFVVTDRANAAKQDYEKSVVVDLTGGKNATAVKKVAALLKIEVGTLPSDEVKPADTEILVILGTDYVK